MSIDNELISRVVNFDDRHAFNTLVRNHQSDIRNYLRRLTKFDYDLADDLAQYTFIQAYKNLKSFRGEATFKTWVLHIAYNCFLQWLRKNKMSFVELSDDHLDAVTFKEPELTNSLEQALMTLTEQQRSIIYLYFNEELSHSEISQVMALPLGTIKSHLARSKQKLKQILQRGEKSHV